jgi:dCTP deaminase
MILSGADVKQYIKYGNLKFSPELREDQFQQNGIDLILNNVENQELEAGSFTLGRTLEFIELPNDLMAFVQLRSSWARKGIIIPPTVVDAGFKGTLTLEIGVFKFQRLPVGERFIHLIFAKLSNPSEPYNGKYQGQVEITHSL